MSPQIVTCQRCGAPIEVPEDGTSYACRFCGTEVLVAVDAGMIAAGMKLDLSNATAFLDRLAQTLETAVPERTKVQRQGSHVASIELHLGADLFLARREPQGVLAQHKRLSRGIALKTATLPLDQWVQLMSAGLAGHANENARATQALAAFFGRR